MAARGGVSTIEQQKRNIIMLAQLYKSKLLVEKCEESLRAFVEEAWKVVEPGVPFVSGFHIDAICEHLEAVANREIRQLLINLPPRHMKSSLVSVMFPVWRWIKHPEEQFLFASYSESLSLRDSRKCRNLIRSAWFQKNWGDRFSLVSDQNEKRRFENDKMGYRLATSVGGSNTGEGGSILCLEGSVKLMTDQGEIPIREIVEGRLPVKVLGSSGSFQKILEYERNPGQELLEIEFSTGEKLTCTKNHPLFVESIGYVPAEDAVSSTYAHLPLRRLRDSFRATGITRCAVEARDVLLPSLLRKVLQRSPKFCLQGWQGRTLMQAVWGSLLGQAERFREASVLLQLLSWTGAADGSHLLCDVPNALPPVGPESALLFHKLREQRQEQRTVYPRAAHGLHLGVQREAKAGDYGSGFLGLCSLWGGKAAAHQANRGAPYRRGEGQSQPNELGFLVQAMSSENPPEEWAEHGIDERTRITNVRSIPAPDFVFNLNVAPDHDYYANGILTHNCFDDANNMKEVNSDVIREGVNDWYDQTMATRLNDPRTGCKVSVQQRGHQHDLTGHLLELGGWEHLVLPARYEGDTKATSIGWSDPRTHEGELLWPERFGPKEMEELEHVMGPMAAAGQLQQRPAPSAGSIFERGWWNYWNPRGTQTGPVVIKNPGQEVIQKTPAELPVAFEQVVQSWDLAFKDLQHNDFVAGHTWGRIGANVYLLARVKERLDFTKTLRAIRTMSEHFPCPEKLVEDKANGPAVIATLRNEIPGLIPVTPEGGKESRAQAVSPYVEAGNVYLPNPDLYPWVKEFVEEYAFFPRGAHDDDVDAGTQALRRLFDSVSQSALPEFRVMPRISEPDSACHIKPADEMNAEIQPHWRRWIAVSPGAQGAALWFCETPRGALRVYRELDLSGVDAHEAGRMIATASLPDIRAYMRSVHSTAKWNIDVLMGKEAFRPIEPIGSYAELLEQGLLSYEPTMGDFDDRQVIQAELRLAKFSTQMAEVEDAAFDRLRELLRFKPVDFEVVEFDRAKSIQLAKQDINLYTAYMAAVEGQVHGDWPKIKFSSELPRTVASVGAAKRETDITDPFLNALVLGICVPKSVMSAKPMRETLYNPHQMQRNKPKSFFRRAG